jgi:hypothetical protein
MTIIQLEVIQIGCLVTTIVAVVLVGVFQSRYHRAQREFNRRIAERVASIEGARAAQMGRPQ